MQIHIFTDIIKKKETQAKYNFIILNIFAYYVHFWIFKFLVNA